ncbi:MAG TPA: tRNA 2-selenouridine(34) synthase MnmH [Rubrivivax sp.]|nr:tRNA 2-selenouridine(34) synthase MnmH [Rubrivivax sp.]
MSLVRIDAAQATAAQAGFDAVIDVRSPAEFAHDHLPGALNWPVLDDEQRRIVGTLYKQVSPLQARKVGAAIVARNIAGHIERWVAGQPRDWRPLVYCWRGGQRSGTLAWFLSQIGFRTAQLQGGYKAFRALVRGELLGAPRRLRFQVLCGRTGSAKTRLLQALAAAGAQTLDLEALAGHRGSVLGALPGNAQPSQKRFDTLCWQALRGFDAARPVYVEGESRRIGALRVPEALIAQLREHGQCIHVELPWAQRLQLLLQEYGHFAGDAEGFCRLLDTLVELRGGERVKAWQAQARAGQWPEVFGALMREHYDPLYERSLRSSYRQLDQALPLALPDIGAGTLQRTALHLLQGEPQAPLPAHGAALAPAAVGIAPPRPAHEPGQAD